MQSYVAIIGCVWDGRWECDIKREGIVLAREQRNSLFNSSRPAKYIPNVFLIH